MIKYFTIEEERLFFNELKSRRENAQTDYARKLSIRNEALFSIMYYCALRVSEVLSLETYFYNSINKEIYCSRRKGGNNNTLRIIDKNIYKSLEKHIKVNNPSKLLFSHISDGIRNGNPLSRKTIDIMMRGDHDRNIIGICQAAGITNRDKWHCHTLRHTRAVRLAEGGFDIKDVQYWLGHSSIENTMIYFEFTSEQHKELYRKLERYHKRTKRNNL